MDTLSSISQVGLISFEHQNHNPEAIFKDVMEDLMVDGVKSSAQVQKDKNTNLTSATTFSATSLYTATTQSQWSDVHVGGLAATTAVSVE